LEGGTETTTGYKRRDPSALFNFAVYESEVLFRWNLVMFPENSTVSTCLTEQWSCLHPTYD